MKKTILFGLLIISFNSFAQKGVNKTDRQLIADLRSNWTSSLQNKQLQKTMDLYTDDAIFYSPGQKAVAGKKAIQALYQQVMRQFTSKCNLQSTGLDVCGPIAWDGGSYNETLIDAHTHKTNRAKGNYLMTLKKQGKEWKISRIMWTEWK
ncbi:nuclear transport factor 2 family protein [Mucilaginibacter mali]|uniref:Nuclear transport factor 2 family protein n=1 Tax=Mucilaginibacter mali TaxID=2740462 RepID=A0A7D4UEE1_9SPHI|nr:DUF4440 domain-containing protein [Mucilaginibacter mali]QKJ31579.1 nuclear transport factor 2 family protein [Mucilaginibacter mali]